MPAKPLMSWDATHRRWWGTVDAKRVVISCRQLAKWSGKPVPQTKEGSYQIANAWYQEKEAEAIRAKPPHHHAEDVEEYRRRRDWFARDGQQDLAEWNDRQAKLIESDPNPDHPSQLDLNRGIRIKSLGPDLQAVPPSTIIRALGDEALWEERHRRDRAKVEAVPEGQTIGEQGRLWLASELKRAQNKLISAGGFENTRKCFSYLTAWAGENTPIDRINAEFWESYWHHVLDRKEWSGDYREKVFRTARSFVSFLAIKGSIASVPNLRDPRHRFPKSHKPIPTMTVEQIHIIIDRSTSQLPLHILLMLNCGMYQSDIADLKQSEVDWQAGRIIRRRSKGSHHSSSGTFPVVNYLLWSKTFELLKRHRETDGELALRTKTGGMWAWERLDDEGKLHSSDNIATNYATLRRKLKAEGIKVPSLMVLRKTGASKLNEHDIYRVCYQEFLGHVPDSLALRKYVKPSQELLDRAIRWIGEEFGLVEKVEP